MIFSSLKKTLRISLKKDAERKKNKLTDAPPRQNESSRLRLCGTSNRAAEARARALSAIPKNEANARPEMRNLDFFHPPDCPEGLAPA